MPRWEVRSHSKTTSSFKLNGIDNDNSSDNNDSVMTSFIVVRE